MMEINETMFKILGRCEQNALKDRTQRFCDRFGEAIK